VWNADLWYVAPPLENPLSDLIGMNIRSASFEPPFGGSSDHFALSYLLLRNSSATCCVAQTDESKKRVRDSYGFY
jgi:hypothetical protein